MTSAHSLLPHIKRRNIGDDSMGFIPEEKRRERELLEIMVENRKAAYGDKAVKKVNPPTYEDLMEARDRHAWKTPLEKEETVPMLKGIRHESDALEKRLLRQQRHRELAKQYKAEGKQWGRPRKVSK